MPKVINSITVDAPTGSITPAINDTFAFTGTPGFSGSGGVQRYDFKWEVNKNGAGYVTIAPSGTGLITSDANPLANTNSQTANSITVTVESSGSYVIRMQGAPTSGGSYTVASATRSVEVAAAPQNLAPGLFSSATVAFFAAVVTAGAVNLAPALFTNNNAFYTPTVEQPGASQDLTPSLVTNTSTFYAPAVASTYSLTPALATNTGAFYGPTVTAGPANLTPSLYANAGTFYGPTVTADGAAQDVTPSLYTNSNAFYSLAISAEAVAQAPPPITYWDVSVGTGRHVTEKKHKKQELELLLLMLG